MSRLRGFEYDPARSYDPADYAWSVVPRVTAMTAKQRDDMRVLPVWQQDHAWLRCADVALDPMASHAEVKAAFHAFRMARCS